MRNLLEEAIECLVKNNKNPSDVLWVGVSIRSTDDRYWPGLEPVHFEWQEFEVLASSYDYEIENCDDGLDPGLIIVGEDWWIEHDGVFFYFKKYPEKPGKQIHPTKLSLSRD